MCGQIGESPHGEGRFALGKKFRKKMRHSLPDAKAVVTNAHGSIPGKSFLLLGELISEAQFSKFRINVKKKKEKRMFHALYSSYNEMMVTSKSLICATSKH